MGLQLRKSKSGSVETDRYPTPAGLTVLVEKRPSVEAVDELLVEFANIATPKEQEIIRRAREVNSRRARER